MGRTWHQIRVKIGILEAIKEEAGLLVADGLKHVLNVIHVGYANPVNAYLEKNEQLYHKTS